MTFPDDDRPEPVEQPIRARVPEHVARGAFSTGVIVMTAQTEIILDFIQNLGRPHQIVARVVMPHSVLPQLVDALQRNMELYRNRWGELPHIPSLPPVQTAAPPTSNEPSTAQHPGQSTPIASGQSAPGDSGSGTTHPGSVAGAGGTSNSAPGSAGANNPSARRPSAQEIYDDLKIKDELLSGAYANAVMIGHGPHEFSFDFITNFFPNSAVSSRVFLSAGQVPRFYDSLKGTWDQLRFRMQPPPGDSPGPSDFGG